MKVMSPVALADVHQHAWDARQGMLQLASLQKTRFQAPRGFGRRAFPNPPSMNPAAKRWWHNPRDHAQAQRIAEASYLRATKAFRRSEAWTGARA